MSQGPIFEPTVERDWSYLIPITLILTVGIFGFFNYQRKDTRQLVVGAFPQPTENAPLLITVLPGDSYTTVARRAINTPGVTGLYAETIIAQKLKTQPLTAGSTITISKQLIAETLASFSSLSPRQQQAWQRLLR